MKFKGRGVMRSNPDFRAAAHLEPIAFTASARGRLEAHAGPFEVRVGRIPIAVRIPFLKRKRARLVVAEIGGFAVDIAPIRGALDNIAVDFGGRLGEQEGLRGQLSGDVGCQTSMEVDGRLSAKGAKISLSLDDEDDDNSNSEGA